MVIPERYDGYYKVLCEEAFIYLMLEKDFKPDDFRKIGLYSIYNISRWWWKKKYAKELKIREVRLKSQMMRGNQRGRREVPPVLVDRELLKQSVDEGRSYEYLSRKFKTSVHLIQRNIAYYGLDHNRTAKRWLDLFLEYAPSFENLTPGITKAAMNYGADKETFFKLSHATFLTALNIADEIEMLVKGKWQSYRETKRMESKIPGTPRKVYLDSEVSFNRNKYERRLSSALLELGIRHSRQPPFGKNYAADFHITGTNIFVELDGQYHANDPKYEKKRYNKAVKDGFFPLHYPIKMDARDIAKDIQCKLNQLGLAE